MQQRQLVPGTFVSSWNPQPGGNTLQQDGLNPCLHCFISDIPRSLSFDMGNPPSFPESGGLLFEASCKLVLLQHSQALGWVLNLLEWPRYLRQVTLPT